jgi:hypothetical protein
MCRSDGAILIFFLFRWLKPSATNVSFLWNDSKLLNVTT